MLGWASSDEHLGDDAYNGDDNSNYNLGEILAPPRLVFCLWTLAPMRKDRVDRTLGEMLSGA